MVALEEEHPRGEESRAPAAASPLAVDVVRLDEDFVAHAVLNRPVEVLERVPDLHESLVDERKGAFRMLLPRLKSHFEAMVMNTPEAERPRSVQELKRFLSARKRPPASRSR